MHPTDFDLDQPIDQEDIKEELRKNGQGVWVSIDLSPLSRSPKHHEKIWFRMRWIYLIPIQGNRSAYFATKLLEGETVEIVVKILYAFLSGLSWSQDLSLSYTYWSSGGMPRSNSYNEAKISHQFDVIDRGFIPDPSEPKARLALAFYREGLSIDHPHYSFLSFYKVINIQYQNGIKQQEWINKQLAKLSMRAKDRLQQIKNLEGS